MTELLEVSISLLGPLRITTKIIIFLAAKEIFFNPVSHFEAKYPQNNFTLWHWGAREVTLPGHLMEERPLWRWRKACHTHFFWQHSLVGPSGYFFHHQCPHLPEIARVLKSLASRTMPSNCCCTRSSHVFMWCAGDRDATSNTGLVHLATR